MINWLLLLFVQQTRLPGFCFPLTRPAAQHATRNSCLKGLPYADTTRFLSRRCCCCSGFGLYAHLLASLSCCLLPVRSMSSRSNLSMLSNPSVRPLMTPAIATTTTTPTASHSTTTAAPPVTDSTQTDTTKRSVALHGYACIAWTQTASSLHPFLQPCAFTLLMPC